MDGNGAGKIRQESSVICIHSSLSAVLWDWGLFSPFVYAAGTGIGCCYLIADHMAIYRSCDPNGRSSTLHDGDSDARPPDCPNFQTASLGGFRCYIESPMRRYCSLPAWMHMWWVFQQLWSSRWEVFADLMLLSSFCPSSSSRFDSSYLSSSSPLLSFSPCITSTRANTESLAGTMTTDRRDDP